MSVKLKTKSHGVTPEDMQMQINQLLFLFSSQQRVRDQVAPSSWRTSARA